MKKILFIIVILTGFNTAYAEFIRPTADIITTKASMEFIKNSKVHSSLNNSEVTFHYEGLYWEEFGEDIANEFSDFGSYFLTIEFVKKFEKGSLYQYYYIPQKDVKKILTMSTNFNKNTYMKVTLPMMVFIEKDDRKTLEGYYYRDFKIYTNNGKCILEFLEAGEDNIIERLSFDQSVLLNVWQILLQNTVY